jgi:DNA-binding NarL/FixJ family response regulator
MNIKIALADDHVVLRKGLAGLLSSLGYSVILEADNGKELIQGMEKNNLPDIVLMDINMPEMDGYETSLWFKKNYPLINVLVLSMYDDDSAIIRMIRNGAKGYVLKEADPKELKQAIDAVMSKGFYYSDMVTGKLVHSIHHLDDNENRTRDLLHLTEKEIEFLKLASTEMTYKEIARQMHISPRTVDGYRDALFEKLNTKSRIGLVLFAIKNGIVQINQTF